MTESTSNTKATNLNASSEPTGSLRDRSYLYSEDFYRYIEIGSVQSARAVVPLVLRELSPASVLDVGCGAGAWLAEYRNCGIADYMGVDGAYVQPTSLLISSEHFQSQNVAQPFDLGRRFDLVQCLEVGEHLHETSSVTLIGNLTRHSDRVLFSAATPGQGGENHINEQSHEFWRLLFARHGYIPFDFLRPMIKGIASVESWYRRNIILYATESVNTELPPAVLHSGIRNDQVIPDMSSAAHKIQARVLSLLPASWVSNIALAKHNLVIASRKLKNL